MQIVTDPDEPVSVFAYVGCFGFVAGEPNRELLENKPEGFAIITPQNEAWVALIEEVYSNARKVTRYAIKKDTKWTGRDECISVLSFSKMHYEAFDN